MALYNRQTIHWKLEVNDLVGFTLSPFIEHKVDVIFKVLSVTNDGWHMNVEVVASSYVPLGTVYLNQPTKGFKKVKLTPLDSALTYNFL